MGARWAWGLEVVRWVGTPASRLPWCSPILPAFAQVPWVPGWDEWVDMGVGTWEASVTMV